MLIQSQSAEAIQTYQLQQEVSGLREDLRAKQKLEMGFGLLLLCALAYFAYKYSKKKKHERGAA